MSLVEQYAIIPEHFKLKLTPEAAPDAVVRAGNARFTVLTSRLIRLEFDPQARFEDRPTQAFWYREQPVPAFDVREVAGLLEIETDALLLRFRPGEARGFIPETLSITLKGSGVEWHPGDSADANLLGTTRTLDVVNGYTPLEPGLMSREGWSVLDDSHTLVLNEASWLEPRTPGATDWYFFGYGHDYKTCLQDYCRVSGGMPMIPRWILGNWWSRYWHYSQDDFMQLINDFEAYALPFSVCIVDMDWHLTETGNDCTGWTGYTWNRQLFPDPPGFLDFLHAKGLRTALNLHPAEGIHPHEESYLEMARRTGLDPESKQPVPFRIDSPEFVSAYFDVLHHPYEEMGVDFWWLDWQQGLTCALPGLDPLWLINHLHFYDLGRDGTRRPFVFSRWGNEGHQRYPIGFSGDSYRTWETLQFEAYMTSTASNVAYGWWSHDIGGHISGVEDPELFARWVQFGAFSPINRIHVTKGEYYDVRPWVFENAEVLNVVRDALQLRHALIPYLYTMAYRAHRDSLPLVQPMYYDYPEADEAYHCPHQYLFGTELIAAPFVTPADPDTGLSRQVVWLPEGEWTHFFTGEHFAGERWHAVYGTLAEIPIFARAGAIVPLGPHSGWGGVDNPNVLNVHLFAGADNTFTLYEDDGETNAYRDGHTCTTRLAQTWADDRLSFTIDAPHGDTSLIPAQRTIALHLHGVRNADDLAVAIDGRAVEISRTYDEAAETLHVEGLMLGAASALRLVLDGGGQTLLSRRDRTRETLLRLLRFFRLHTGVRNHIAEEIDAIIDDPQRLAPYVLVMETTHARALFETLCEAGVHTVTDTHDPAMVVVWNNREDARFTYRYADAYLHFGMLRDANHARGVVPRYAAFTPPVHAWRQGAYGEYVHPTQWQVQIDYFNLLSVAEGYRERTP
ncbi:glycoside hydrolase family 31 protein [Aggregatilinea lenta]|uniref:glycoside hydrolase family 31 protein n=1 Tax=Aggregatilinea lenta TaxID=913108 RepID=UPI0013C330EC|nr:TIM-barrel domain-containing protein [Aggregatilinea lenta]